MHHDAVVVPPDLDLRQWVEDYVYRYHHKTFPVSSNGHLEGLINTQALIRIPRSEWGLHTVAEVMRRDVGAISVSPRADALQALEKMHARAPAGFWWSRMASSRGSLVSRIYCTSCN